MLNSKGFYETDYKSKWWRGEFSIITSKTKIEIIEDKTKVDQDGPYCKNFVGRKDGKNKYNIKIIHAKNYRIMNFKQEYYRLTKLCNKNMKRCFKYIEAKDTVAV